MWFFVFFDLPVLTKLQRKAAATFRKLLERDGFTMMQFSIYVRACPSHQHADVHEKRTIARLPESGSVKILRVTDKQYSNMFNFWKAPPKQNDKKSAIKKDKEVGHQLELEFF